MKAKRWIAALLAGALMLCGLPVYAAPTWTVPKQAQKLRYTFGERGFIEQDEQKIQQVLKTLQQMQPTETKLEQGQHTIRIDSDRAESNRVPLSV